MRGWAAVAAILLLGATLAGCDWMPGRPTEADRPVIPSQVKDFAALYRGNCAGCHGADGRFGAANPLNDPLYLALVDDAALRRVTAQGVPGTTMAAFAQSAGGDLTDEQIDILVRGMRQHWGQPEKFENVPLPPYAGGEAPASGESAAAAQRGRSVYAGHCSRCHGPGGRGGPKAGSVVDASFLALVSDQALRTTVIAGRPDLGMPDWRGAGEGKPLTTQEISDVVAWLAAHRPPSSLLAAGGPRAEANEKPEAGNRK